MANKKKFYGKRMVPEYLITKLEELEPGGGDYTAGNGIDIEDNEISIDDTVETKANATSRFVSKASLTDDSIAQIIVGNSDIDIDNVDLNAVYSQDVKSQLSLEPTSAILRTMSGTDTSTIGVSATEIDITTGTLKYNTKEVATTDQLFSGNYNDLTNKPDLSTYQTTSNLVTSLSSLSTDTQYPSAKCVYDIVGNIETLLAAI